MTHRKHKENLLKFLLQKIIAKDFSLLVFKHKYKMFKAILWSAGKARVINLSVTFEDTYQIIWKRSAKANSSEFPP